MDIGSGTIHALYTRKDDSVMHLGRSQNRAKSFYPKDRSFQDAWLTQPELTAFHHLEAYSTRCTCQNPHFHEKNLVNVRKNSRERSSEVSRMCLSKTPLKQITAPDAVTPVRRVRPDTVRYQRQSFHIQLIEDLKEARRKLGLNYSIRYVT